jgi:hypothetical protein
MPHFTITRTIASPLDRVWSLAGNFLKAPGPGIEVKVEKNSSNANNVGAERTITIGSVKVRKRLESVSPGKSFSYKVLSGAPMKDHQATVTLRATGQSTEIRWEVAFTPKVMGTGWVVAMVTKRLLTDTLMR